MATETKTFVIGIYADPLTQQAPWTALRFARACLHQGHKISQIFFYLSGVQNANAFAIPPDGVPNITHEWQSLNQVHQIPLITCIASAAARGILDAAEAKRYDKPSATLAEGFSLGTLAQYINACDAADRIMVFKAGS